MTRDEAIRMLGEIDKRLKRVRDKFEEAVNEFRHGGVPEAREAWQKVTDLEIEVREIKQERAAVFETLEALRRAGFVQRRRGELHMSALMLAIRITKPGYEGVYEPRGLMWVHVKSGVEIPDLTVRRWDFEGFVEGYPSDIDATETLKKAKYASDVPDTSIPWRVGDRVRISGGPLFGVSGTVVEEKVYPLVVIEVDADSVAAIASGDFSWLRANRFRIEMNSITSLEKINFRETAAGPQGRKYDEVRDWISAKIAKLMEEGKPQKQAVAIALSMARKKFPGQVPEKEGERYAGSAGLTRLSEMRTAIEVLGRSGSGSSDSRVKRYAGRRWRVLINGDPRYDLGPDWWNAAAAIFADSKPGVVLQLQRETGDLTGEWETEAEMLGESAQMSRRGGGHFKFPGRVPEKEVERYGETHWTNRPLRRFSEMWAEVETRRQDYLSDTISISQLVDLGIRTWVLWFMFKKVRGDVPKEEGLKAVDLAVWRGEMSREEGEEKKRLIAVL